MKKTILSLALLALAATAMANPLQHKREAYEALRTNTPTRPILDMSGLLRNEAGTVSTAPRPGGNTCAICGLDSTGGERPGGGTALPPGNPTENPNAGGGPSSVLDTIPAGLGVPPGPIERTATGTGAAWTPPSASPEDQAKWQNYELLYQAQLQQYNLDVTNIINSYMDTNNGKLARARVEVLNTVERELAAWTTENPNATPVQRANYESERIAANSGKITSLTAQYQSDLQQAKANFDAMMNYYRNGIENPPETGGGA